MNRNEAILRELNLHPLWVRRDASAQEVAEQPAPSTPLGVQADVPLMSRVHQEDVAIQHAPAISSEIATLDWTQLKAQVKDCSACKLRAGCTQTVFGFGDENAEWLFVGEGPGADEDVQGEPFVGQAGKLLDNMLRAIKLKRGNNVYIANIVKCRPPNNRTPEAGEIATCMPYLQKQIALIKPKLIVALGKTAATSLLGKDASLGSLRGRLHAYQGIPMLITYHPAYLLRSPAEKIKAWEDLQRAVNTMRELSKD